MKSVSVLLVPAVIILHSILKTKAVEFSAPFLVSIQHREEIKDETTVDHICTGAIISPSLVLTSEICLMEGIEELYVAAGVLDEQYRGKGSKITSYVIPEHITLEEIAVATINPPFLLDGDKIAKIQIDSERFDMYSDMFDYPFRVFLYFYSLKGDVRREDMYPKNFQEGVKILNKHMFLDYHERYEDTGCNAEVGTSIGSPVIRDNLLIGVVSAKTIEAKCDVEGDAIAIRSSIFVNWIEDQIRKDEFHMKQKRVKRVKAAKGNRGRTGKRAKKGVTDTKGANDTKSMNDTKGVNDTNVVVPPVSAPFLASIQRYTPTGKLKHFCSGSLIAADLILTAAICLKHGAEDLLIVVGISNLVDPVGQRRQIMSYEISESPDPLRQQIAVARVFPPFSIDKYVKTIDLDEDFICGELPIDLYIYSSENISKNQFMLYENENFSKSYFEMKENLPDANSTMPDANSTMPDTNSTMPGANSTMPVANLTIPVANSTMPNANSTMPGANSTMPNANSTMPGANSTMPDANSTMPDANTTMSDPDCPFKLFSLTGGPAVFEGEVVGVVIFDLVDDYCHTHTPKLAARVSFWKQWIAQQMKFKL